MKPRHFVLIANLIGWMIVGAACGDKFWLAMAGLFVVDFTAHILGRTWTP